MISNGNGKSSSTSLHELGGGGTHPEMYTMIHDGVSHHPLGAGSYIYKEEYAKALLCYLNMYPFEPSPLSSAAQQLPARKLTVHIGAQPNNSPHAGTIITFSLGFILARKLKRTYDQLASENAGGMPPLGVTVSLDLVDTAPDSKYTVQKDGVSYQRSQRNTDAMSAFLPDYNEILRNLSTYAGDEVSYVVTRQADLLRSPYVPRVLHAILQDQVRTGRELSPESERLALRVACPVVGCGVAEKHGRLNSYDFPVCSSLMVTFNCFEHGPHICRLDSVDIEKFEFNTPLRNLTRGLVNMLDTIESQNCSGEHQYHLRVTGSDYSGTYQEQLFFRQVPHLIETIIPASQRMDINLPIPVISHAPLLTDWSGVKLSKSLYVKDGAYDYLIRQGKDYLLSYSRMKEMGKPVEVIFREVEDWVDNPRKLFRNYSVEYFARLFDRAEADRAESWLKFTSMAGSSYIEKSNHEVMSNSEALNPSAVPEVADSSN